jgi:hypothetical protein
VVAAIIDKAAFMSAKLAGVCAGFAATGTVQSLGVKVFLHPGATGVVIEEFDYRKNHAFLLPQEAQISYMSRKN